MKTTTALLTLLVLLITYASAQPLVIIGTHIKEVTVRAPEPTAQLFNDLAKRQGILDQINSALGIKPKTTDSDNSSPSTKSNQNNRPSSSPPSRPSATVRTLGPPAVQTSSSSSDDSDNQTSTSSESSTSTESSSTASSSSTLSTVPPSISATPTPSTSIAQTQPTSSPIPSQNNDSGLPPGGLAATVILLLLVVIVTAWLVFKYHPKSRAWWAARQERKYKDRSYRDAIDGSDSVNLRQQALGVSRRQTMKSFFVPSTVNLGNNQEIRRKPVNWGESTPPMPTLAEKSVPIGHSDTEKICMTADAAPMGQIERYSYISPHSTHCELPAPVPAKAMVSPASVWQKDELEKLPPVSPISIARTGSVATSDRAFPALPPVPQLPELTHAKRGSDGVFRLN